MSPTTPVPRARDIGNIPALMAALLVAVFAFQLNASMLSPALATMQVQLDASAAQIGVTQTAFFASAALFSLFLPRWGDLVGRKKILLLALIGTLIGCVVSALAPNVTVLGIGRVIQGTAGPIVPMALIMLHVQVPDSKRYARLMAVLTAVNGGIAGIDALAGGWLAGTWGFRAVFVAMAIVAAVAVAAVFLGAMESRSEERMPMDWIGVVLLVAVLAGLYFAFTELGKLAQASWLLVGVLIVVAVIAWIAFWNVEKRVRHPLVAVHYLKERRTWGLLSTTVLTMTGVFAVMNGLVPNLAQDGALSVGLTADNVSYWTLTPYAIAGLIMGPIAGQLAAKFGFIRVLQGGLVLSAAGLAVAAALTGAMNVGILLALSIFIGITYAGVANIMLNGLGVVLSPPDNQGYLPGMNSGAFNLGAGLSFAILFAINTGVGQASGAVAGYRAGIIAGGVLILLALVVSFLIPKPPEQTEDAGAEVMA